MRGAIATRFALLSCCVLVACVDGRASLGRFAEASPTMPAAAGTGGAGIGGAGLGGAPVEVAVPDAGPVFEPEPPVTPDAGTMRPPDRAPPTIACATGSYLGQFECALRSDGIMPPPQSPGGPPSSPMTAALPFRLELSADGTVADIVEGDFAFAAWGVGFTGRFEGQLDCASGRFSATIVDGMTGPLFMGGPSTFVGALEGRLVDPATGTLAGSWWHGPMPDTGCTGTWTAMPQPP